MIIRKVGETKSDGIKALVYGPAGAGKTYSISTIPEPESVLILSAEAGLMSIRDVAPNIDTITIMSRGDLREAFEFVRDGKGKRYKTIVLDSLSEIAQQVLAYEKLPDKEGKPKDGRYAYGNMAERVLSLAKEFRDLEGRNVILLCQEEKMQDDEKRIYRGPSMPGKMLGPQLTHLTDLLFAMRMRKDETGIERMFQTSPLANEYYVAKDRSGKLAIMEEPNWASIFAKING